MTLPTRRNRALRGMGDDTTTVQFFGGVTPSDPGFDVCDAAGNCTSAQSVLTPAQLSQMAAASAVYNKPAQISASGSGSSNTLLYVIAGAAILALMASR